MTNTETSKTALEIATKVSHLLSRRGDTSLLYLTAEMEPYSSQFKPDILFVPARGPNSGESFFVELATFRPRRVARNYTRVLPEHRDFVIESSDSVTLHYGFATDENLDNELQTALIAQNIKVFVQVKSGEQLAEEIISWTKSF